LGTGIRQFRGWLAAAHILAYLRIADVVTFAVARLATDLAGYSLVGQVSHPLDDEPNFVTTAWFTPFGPALPGRSVPVPVPESTQHGGPMRRLSPEIG
jgi:hypothetical protein